MGRGNAVADASAGCVLRLFARDGTQHGSPDKQHTGTHHHPAAEHTSAHQHDDEGSDHYGTGHDDHR